MLLQRECNLWGLLLWVRTRRVGSRALLGLQQMQEVSRLQVTSSLPPCRGSRSLWNCRMTSCSRMSCLALLKLLSLRLGPMNHVAACQEAGLNVMNLRQFWLSEGCHGVDGLCIVKVCMCSDGSACFGAFT